MRLPRFRIRTLTIAVAVAVLCVWAAEIPPQFRWTALGEMTRVGALAGALWWIFRDDLRSLF